MNLNCGSGDLKSACALILLCGVVAIALPGQTFTTLLSFNGTNGANPLYGPLVQGIDGNLYGTTSIGGSSGNCSGGCGTIFKVTLRGNLTTFHNFDGTDGARPDAGLLLAFNGNLYGTTSNGGLSSNCSGGCGTIFKISPDGDFATLHSFDGSEGYSPNARLLLASSGDFYGTTSNGGAKNYCLQEQGCGTIFTMTPGGTLTALYSFCAIASCPDGANPFGGLVEGVDGDLYGTTSNGGAKFLGTVFKITRGGTLTTLDAFDSQNGANPYGGLVQATNHEFYGTASGGGVNGDGTIFEITQAGGLRTLHTFNGSDGGAPFDGLVQATNGDYYGTTFAGGTASCPCGTIFKITQGRLLTTLYNFDGPNGQWPYSGLVQATNGMFYGATFSGGSSNLGTIFSLSVGLDPFVKTLPTFGEIGSEVTILGTNFTGATSVLFNGTPAASFTVNSRGSAISTTVPARATTGTVQVVTPTGTLSSNLAFLVRP